MKLFERIVHWVAQLGSIIGIVVLFLVDDELKAFIALIAIILFLVAVYIRVHVAVDRYLSTKYHREYATISSFARYTTTDGSRIEYQLYRTIQCKRLSMTEYWHEYAWTGSVEPTLTSRLQDVDPNPVRTPADQYDRVRLGLRRSLRYNETEIVHLAATCNDADKKSEPQVSFKVPEPVCLIHWRIELRHLPDTYAKTAVLEKRRIDSQLPEDYQEVEQVSFDRATKSFEHLLHNPTTGYFYRLRWERS